MYKDYKDKVVVFSEMDVLQEDFDPPRRYFIRDALGNYVFLRSNSRTSAQKVVNEIFGEGKYSVGEYY